MSAILQIAGDSHTVLSDEVMMPILKRMASNMSDENETKPTILKHIGEIYKKRFGQSGDKKDIDSAIDWIHQAVIHLPDTDIGKPSWLAQLGDLYERRFQSLGEPADLDKAIEYKQKAVIITPDIHPDKRVVLTHLGISHQSRFQHLGEVADIEQAINCLKVAVLITLDGWPEKPTLLNNLGIAYGNRFNRLGDLADIDIAIGYKRQALLLTPNEDPDRPHWLASLAISHQDLFERLGELPDLDTAIEYLNEAVSLTSDECPEKPAYLNNLGVSYESRFERLGHLADVKKAIELIQKAISLTPDGHPDRPTRMANLGVSHESRFKHAHKLQDSCMAISYKNQAVLLTTDKNPSKPDWLTNLGVSYESRFQQLGDPVDIDNAIECMTKAVSLTPDGHPAKHARLINLGAAHEARFLHLKDGFDMMQAAKYVKSASHCAEGHPYEMFKASCVLARLCSSYQIYAPIDAYQRAMELLPQVLWLGATVDHRYDNIKSIDSIPIEAAATAIASGAHELALEWLEEGRSIIWNQLLQLRSPQENLRRVSTTLADELQMVSRELDYMGLTRSNMLGSSKNMASLEQAARRHRYLAAERNRLIDNVRQLSGFETFLKPQKIAQLARASHSSTVVFVNVAEDRCDALALSQGSRSLIHVPLTSLSRKKCVDMQSQMLVSLNRIDTRTRNSRRPIFLYGTDATANFESVLASLWADVVEPILSAMGYLMPQDSAELPRVTWCTTGALAFLPLHAAGRYDKPDARVFNYVVSSYTPSISALIKPGPIVTKASILAIGQAALGSPSQLPGTIAELDRIQAQANAIPVTRLDEDSATPEAALDALKQHPWVHLACHASQNVSNPTSSAFKLHGGHLDLATISREPLPNAELAFLSACETATGDEQLPDEAVHLAAGMIMAGYRTVIATMWSIKDDDAPIIAEHFYAQLLDGGFADSRKAARALHHATGHLRDKVGEKSFARWVPYIHLGQ